MLFGGLLEAVFDVHFAGGVGLVGDEIDRARAEGLGAAGQRVQQRGAEALPLEARVDVPCYTVHASLTARPFFERRGYAVTQRQEVERRGVKLPNFAMEKRRS